jgi:hypothetical protein
MNKIKIKLVPFSAMALIFSLLSFTNIQRPFATVVKLYDSTPYTEITTGQCLSIVPTELYDYAYWSNGSVGLHGCSDYLKAIEYSSSQLTFQQAIQIVKNYYTLWGSLPQDGDSICGFWGSTWYQVTVWREPAD